MLKGIYSFLLAYLFCCQAIKAQTITDSVIPNAPYTQYTQYLDTSINEGPSGANQVWNFGSAIKSDSLIHTNYVLPNTTANDSFPNATIAVSNNQYGGYNYFAVNDSQELFLGSWDSNGRYPYSDPEVLLVFPCSLGTTYIDSWTKTSYLVFSETIVTAGTTTITADASGTITTPAGIFDSVVRIKVVKDYSDSTFSAGTLVGTNTYNYIYYWWYKAGVKGYIFNVSYPVIANGNDTMKQKSVSYQYGSPTTGITAIDEGNQLNVFPNPAHDLLNISLQSTHQDNIIISMENILGKEVYNSGSLTLTTGANSFQAPISGFSAGLYILHCKSNGTDVLRKVMIE